MIAKHRHSTASLSPCRARAKKNQVISVVSMPGLRWSQCQEKAFAFCAHSNLRRSLLCLPALQERPEGSKLVLTCSRFWNPICEVQDTDVSKAKSRQPRTQGRRPTRSEIGAMMRHPTAFLAVKTGTTGLRLHVCLRKKEEPESLF